MQALLLKFLFIFGSARDEPRALSMLGRCFTMSALFLKFLMPEGKQVTSAKTI
jgi:hypothetical protein